MAEKERGKWKGIYEDLQSSYTDPVFLENYVHNNQENFEITLRIKNNKEDMEKILDEFKQNVFNILKDELEYFKKIEGVYLEKVNSSLKERGVEPIKNIKDALLYFNKTFKSSLKNTDAYSQIKIKEASSKMTSLFDGNTKQSLIGKDKTKEQRNTILEKRDKEILDAFNNNLKHLNNIVKNAAKKYEALIGENKGFKKADERTTKIIIDLLKKSFYGKDELNNEIDFSNFDLIDFINANKDFDDSKKINFWKKISSREYSSPRGNVFESDVAELGAQRDADSKAVIFADFFSTNKEESLKGYKLANISTTDIIATTVSLEEKKVEVGISLKLRKDSIVGGEYKIGDYLEYSGFESKNFLSYLRANYNIFPLASGSGQFQNLDEELSLWFGIPRFLNKAIENISEDGDITYTTIFIIIRDKVYLVSSILNYILKKLEKTKYIKKQIIGLKGFKASARVREKNFKLDPELLLAKRNFLVNFKGEKDSFYQRASTDRDILNFLDIINSNIRKNPIEKANYSIDLKNLKLKLYI